MTTASAHLMVDPDVKDSQSEINKHFNFATFMY